MDTALNDIATRYARAVNMKYKPKAIYLYGSQAKGTSNKYSDIDIAVVVEPVNNDVYMEIFAGLYSIAAEFNGNIEPNLLIDYGNEDRYSFLHEVKKTGQMVLV